MTTRVQDTTLERRLAPIRSEYPFASRFHQLASGARMHYLDEGPRDAAAVLFLHGNPTWSFAWRNAVRELSAELRCVAPDHVGCGLSDKPEPYPYRLAQHVANVEELVLALDLRRITLCLHDWGGAIGMGLARRHPERIARIALMNTAAFPFASMPLRIAACRVPVFGRLAVRGANAFARAATFMTVEKPLPPVVKRGYLLPYTSYAERVGVCSFVEDIPMARTHPSFGELEETARSLARFVDRPVRILWGERDWCFTPAFLAEWQRRWPHAETRRFPHAGHFLFEDERRAVVRELADFVGAHRNLEEPCPEQ